MVMEIENLSEEREASAPKKRKRNLPGMPDPDAEVVALSPKALMATNRFVCEICSKGFQRDQNLQLHRRGHNLPWKLKQRSSVETIRKRVYVCPEPTCVHHDPSRALGDLTGIKKHFCRKHGEKKWKCDKCSKKYAVQSDWKAHLKTCGTREYRCDCGTFFSRRDSFITHRAFCDALTGEKIVAPISVQQESPKLQSLASSPSSNQNGELGENSHQIPPSACINGSSSSSTSKKGSSLFANVFASSAIGGSLQPQPSKYSDLLCAMARSECPITEPTSLSLSSKCGSMLFALEDGRKFAPPTQPAMSATALLQKAAEMGATANGGSFLTSLGVSLSSSSSWNNKVESNPSPALLSGNEITVSFDGNTRLTELMMPPSTLFGPEPTTLDFLGLGMGGNCTSKGGFLALLTSIGGDLQVAKSFRDKDLSREDAWEGGNERRSNAS